ncbi:astacin-like metalloendopeptidase [Striga asiatica]|uniref:Astacin-like metalloendopeptidase n=1 Tax=Striga asiatica TaxID=4170 RepID=A0A5A7QQ81_STRAF|nr:astacin-like metalloendopeptidase [Striga asiatica]
MTCTCGSLSPSLYFCYIVKTDLTLLYNILALVPYPLEEKKKGIFIVFLLVIIKMKLLGWMHRKLMQNSTDPVKSYTIENHSSCFSSDDQNYYIAPTKTPTRQSLKRERSPNSFDEPFDFLSIGTFGTELLLNTGPPTPTLPAPNVEALTGQPIEITENDLDLISHELEKFLESEDVETGYDSSERSSRASVITLTDQGNVQILASSCPLQNYLLAAPVREEVKKTRMSLEELFKEGKNCGEENGGASVKKGEGVGGKGNVARLVKKVVKRLSSNSSNSTSGFDDIDDDDDNAGVSLPIKKKLAKKLVKMFQKKVYPEEMTGKRFFKVTKSNKKNKYNPSKEEHLAGHNNSDQSAKSKKKTMRLFCTGVCTGSSPVNAGHWIKTDSDYLVLEL